MLFTGACILIAISFVWGWYRHNQGNAGFDDWDNPRDWHIKEKE